jgi:AcrR family transcriptional regulator
VATRHERGPGDAGRRRTGRRPGAHGARQAILAAARRSFGERGFAATTIRAIAADAGVDPALVLHYFGSKADLFAAAVHLPVVPSESLAELAATDRDQLGEAIVRLVTGMWDNPDDLAVWLGLLRSATTDERAADTLREFITTGILEQIGRLLDTPDAELRVALVGSQILGLGIARHVLRIEPLASASAKQLVATVAPNLQRYLTGDLDAPG